MKPKRFILVALLSIFFHATYAQGVITFTKTNHDFGNVKEGVQATYDFEFTNTGKSPVIISNVSASCGCTTPFWTKDPVLPGKKGKVTASFNSTGRPGMFNKSVTVVSNAEPSTLVLTIQGSVLTNEQSLTPEQKANSPVIQLDKIAYNFGKIEKGQTVKHVFKLSNTGKSDLQIERVQSACACVNFTVNKDKVAPGEQATLEIKFTPRTIQQEKEVVTILSNDLKNPNLQLTLQAEVVESLSSQNLLKEQKTVVPFKQ